MGGGATTRAFALYSRKARRKRSSAGAQGQDYLLAMDCAPVPTDATLMQFVFERYIRDILPNKGADTQRENKGSLRQLRAVFDTAPIDAITPQDIARYRDARTAKVRAKRGDIPALPLV